MEKFITFHIRVILLTLLITLINLVKGQISNTPCTTSMMSSFTPCANMITGSINNGLVPLTTCCDSLRTLISTNMDCACLVISANAPFFQLPINQALSLSLSTACNINGASLQCKASGSPLPAPGPAVLGPHGPTPLSDAATPLSPQVSVVEAHRYENLQLARTVTVTPAPMEAETPPGSRIRPVLTPTPSSASSHISFSPKFALVLLLIIMV